MKTIEYALDGKIYHLLLNGTALFAFYDQFGRDADLMESLKGETKESYDAATWMLAEFSRQGELYRRAIGEDRGAYLSQADAAITVRPFDIPGLKFVLMDTIAAGFRRDHPDESPHDVYLEELQKKTAPPGSRWQSICSLLSDALGSLLTRG